MAKNIYERNFAKLLKLLPNLNEIEEPIKLTAPGFMDLHVEILVMQEEHFDIALTHYYEQNGDLLPDPDIAVRVYPKTRMVEGLTFHDIHGYQMVYPEDGKVDLRAKEEINDFLGLWLRNLLSQGHKATEPALQGAIDHAKGGP